MDQETNMGGASIDTSVEGVDVLAAKDAEIAKLSEDLKNYKNVALKRLGKLPGDSDFMGDAELSVSEQVKMALLEKELELANRAKEDEVKKVLRENAELKRALQNRPEISIGGSGDSSNAVEVKDNIFTNDQLDALKKRAEMLKVDPEKFIANAKKNFSARR